MTRYHRRKFLLGLGALGFAGGGWVVSGAGTLTRQGSQSRENWVSMSSADLLETEDQTDADDETGDGTTTDNLDRETRVQVIRDPTGGGPNRGMLLGSRPHFVPSERVAADDNGFLAGIDLDGLHPRAATRIGRLDGTGRPTEEQSVAFMIANVSGVGRPDMRGRTVDVSLDAFTATGEPINSDQLRFPWALNRVSGGPDLLGQTVRVLPRTAIGVGIVVDDRRPGPAVQRFDRLDLRVSKA